MTAIMGTMSEPVRGESAVGFPSALLAFLSFEGCLSFGLASPPPGWSSGFVSRSFRPSNSTGVPRCPKCGGIIKPDVVLYEEGLDEEVLSGAVQAIRKADTLIIGGTSLVVYPAAGLIRYFRGRHLVVINMQPTGADAQADLCIAKPIGQVLSEDITVG